MKSTASLSFKFRLPKGAQSVDKLEEIVALAIKYIDVCHDVSIPASVRERNLKKRKKWPFSIVKENSREKAAKKREEDMRRKDEKFKQLTPAQQAKAMEREELRRRKKMIERVNQNKDSSVTIVIFFLFQLDEEKTVFSSENTKICILDAQSESISEISAPNFRREQLFASCACRFPDMDRFTYP